MYKLTDDKAERKRTPIFSGVRAYFPLALAAVSRVSWAGNEQHNPGEPLHWAREKSVDHLDAADRHLTEYAMGNLYDTDGEAHLAKAMWRIGAQLQLDEEARLDAAEVEEDWRDGTLWKLRNEIRLPPKRADGPTAAQIEEYHETMTEIDNDNRVRLGTTDPAAPQTKVV